MLYPELRPLDTAKTAVHIFGGYVHTPCAPENSFYDMSNISPDAFPALSSRAPRGRWRRLFSDEQGKPLYYDDVFYFNKKGITAAANVNGRLCYASSQRVFAEGSAVENLTLEGYAENEALHPSAGICL